MREKYFIGVRPIEVKLKGEIVVPTEALKKEPYASIICYPKASKVELNHRLKELKVHNVEAIEFTGKSQVMNHPVLGKGHVGIVTIVHICGEKAALKIRRIDANRVDMHHEAEMLRKANSVLVGPKLLNVSKNFLLTEFVDGPLFIDWFDTDRKKFCLKRVIKKILEECWLLDSISLDHGELSHAPKHLIMDQGEKPVIIDFESASLNRKPANVTSICQFLFIGGFPSKKLNEIFGERRRAEIIRVLRQYKNDQTRGYFEKVLQICLQ